MCAPSRGNQFTEVRQTDETEMADVLYEVEQIVGKKINPGRRVSYLVRWKGFSSDHDSWEPASNLEACKKLMLMYNNQDENTVIKEDGQMSTIGKLAKAFSPGKQPTNKVERRLSRHHEKEKMASKTDLQEQKDMSADIYTHEKTKSSKEHQNKLLSSKTTQAGIRDSPKKLSASRAKLSAMKQKLPEKMIESCGDSLGQSKIKLKKTKTPDGKKERNLAKPDSDSTKKVSRKRKHPDSDIISTIPIDLTENEASQNGPPIPKKQKLPQPTSNEDSDHDKTKTVAVGEDVVDLTKCDIDSYGEEIAEEIEISDEEEEEDDNDDENILYSLNSDCDLILTDDLSGVNKNTESVKANKDSCENSKTSVITKFGNKGVTKESSAKNGGGKKKNKRMSLIDSKKSAKAYLNDSDPVRSTTPPPHYTSVKDMMGEPTNPDPSKPSGNSLPDPVSPEASETYLADVPSSFPVPAEEPLTEEPLSPSSLLYKSLVDSLPDQLHPLQKGNGKKGKGDIGSGSGYGQIGKSLFGPSGKGAVERRTSVRSTECAFRYKQIVVKKCSRYTQIWLNTTTVMKNALNPMVIQEIVSALNSAKYDDSRLVLFSGLGNVFCSGTDLHYLVSGDRAVAARQMAEKIRELTKTFITFPKPIIAAVSGAAVGLGVALLAVCDVVYASDKASFHLPYSQLSQTPEGCSSFTLPLIVGLPAANELLYGGRKITAIEAYQLGLLSKVFWPTLMMQEIIPRVQNMAGCSSKALEATKLLVRSHHRTKMELTNETECNLLLESWFSVECQQAIEAYIGDEKNFSF